MKTMKNVFYLMMIISFMFSFSCNPEEELKKGNVEGTVRNIMTGNAVPGVNVTVGDRNSVTGIDGMFFIQDVKSGQNKIIASKSGYDLYENMIQVESGGSTYYDIQMRSSDTMLESPKDIFLITGDREITIRWKFEPSVMNYNIYMSNYPGVSKTNHNDKRSTNTGSFTWKDLSNNMIYYFVVTAENSQGESRESMEVQGIPMGSGAIPSNPQGIKAFPSGDGEITIKWPYVEFAKNYKIYMRRSPGVSKFNYEDFREVSNYEFIWNGLENGLTYYFVVTALNSYGESGESEEANAMPATTGSKPNIPRNMHAIPGNNEIILIWDQVVNANKYNLYMDTTPGITKQKYMDIRTINSTEYTWNALENGKTYYFAVAAVNSYGDSELSYEINIIPEEAGNVPDTPTGINYAVISLSEVDLSWNMANNARSYNIYMDTTSDVSKSSYLDMRNTTSNNYTWIGLDTTYYFFTITSSNTYGESDESVVVRVNPARSGSAPNPPSGVTPIPMDRMVSINWGNVPGAIQYKIYMSSSETVSKTVYDNMRVVNSNEYLWTGLENGIAYYFVVTALNDFGESNASIYVKAIPGTGGGNTAPVLSRNYVTPKSGTTINTYSFYVDYFDADGQFPVARYIYINGTPYVMDYSSGSGFSNGTYFYQTKLGEGSYNYYFEFSDGNGGSTRFPQSGVFNDPVVTSVEIQISGRIVKNSQPLTNKEMKLCGTVCHEGNFEFFEILNNTDYNGNYQFTILHNQNIDSYEIHGSNYNESLQDVFNEWKYQFWTIESEIIIIPEFNVYYSGLFSPAENTIFKVNEISESNPIVFQWTNGGRADIQKYNFEIWLENDPDGGHNWSTGDIIGTTAFFEGKFHDDTKQLVPGKYQWRIWCLFGNDWNDGWNGCTKQRTIIIE